MHYPRFELSQEDKTGFFRKYRKSFEDAPGMWPDDDNDHDLIALIVLDDVPIETINKLLNDNFERGHTHDLWLADTYDNCPNFHPDHLGHGQGTQTPIDPNWRSPFLGKTIEDAVAFIRGAPKPPKPLNKKFCAVLKGDYFERGDLLICKAAVEGSQELSLSDEEYMNDLMENPDKWDNYDELDDEGLDFESMDIDAATNEDGGAENSQYQYQTVSESVVAADEYEVQVMAWPSEAAATFQGGYGRHNWQYSGKVQRDW